MDVVSIPGELVGELCAESKDTISNRVADGMSGVEHRLVASVCSLEELKKGT